MKHLLDWIAGKRGFLLVVLLPTALTAIYFFGVAARQFESETHFVVKTAAQSSAGYNPGLAQMFGMSSAMNPSQSESFSVGDYLSSHDAVAALGERLNLTAVFRRPEADLIAKLYPAKPSAEQLLKYYRRQVKVAYSSDTGITTLKVHAFRPGDAHAIAEALLELGEQRVNLLNRRALENSASVAEEQLRQAEAAAAASQGGMTRFRQAGRDIDPERSSAAQISLVAGMQGQLAQARAQLSALKAAVDADSPQYVAMAARVRALQAQVDGQVGRLAGTPHAMAPTLGAFEDLKLRQDFAAKRYEAAASAVQTAQEQALKQQLYVVRVVEPNRPQKALFPQRWLMLASVFFAALLTYGVGVLVLAGVREHAA